MQYAHGLDLKLETINEILKIAQEKEYIKSNESFFKCDNFRFDEANHKFEFYVQNANYKVTLDMDKFIECYTLVLKRIFKLSQ